MNDLLIIDMLPTYGLLFYLLISVFVFVGCRGLRRRTSDRIRPLPVGSSERTVRYMHLSAACSSGKWPRARMERLNLALSDSMALVVQITRRISTS